MIGVVKMDDKVANFGVEQFEIDFEFGARAILYAAKIGSSGRVATGNWSRRKKAIW